MNQLYNSPSHLLRPLYVVALTLALVLGSGLSAPVLAQGGCASCEICKDPTRIPDDPCYGNDPVTEVPQQVITPRGRPAVITPSSYPTQGQYIWDHGATTDSITVGPGTYTFTYHTSPGCSTSDTVTVIEVDVVQVAVNVFLEGPYNPSGLMNDDLRASGLLSPTEPYTALGHAFTAHAGAAMDPAFMGDNTLTAPVDWVVVELRDPFAPNFVIASQPAVLRRTGEVVGPDGQMLLMENVLAGQYLVAVLHRNHLGVMTNFPVFMSANSADPVNFNAFTTPTFGFDAQKPLPGGQMGLATGDANFSHSIDAGDRSAAWNKRNDQGYLLQDVNMDGVVNAADRSLIWNNRNRTQQVPN